MDVQTGTGAMTNVEYIPYHVCSSKTVTHRIPFALSPGHTLKGDFSHRMTTPEGGV